MFPFSQTAHIFRSATLLLVLTAGCRFDGAKPAQPQPIDEVETPAYPTGVDPLHLLQDNEERSFFGPLVLFSPQASPASLQQVLRGVQDTRVAKANWLMHRDQKLTPVITQASAIASELQTLATSAFAGAGRRQAQAAAAGAWFGQRLSELKATDKLDETAFEHANQVFNAYCEAKVWQLALDARLAQRTFLARPTALQLCEPRYQAAGLFTGDLCTPASSDEGKSYFACLWSEGVFKTALFAGKYDTGFEDSPEESKSHTLKTWLQDGTLFDTIVGDRGPQLSDAALNQDRLASSRVLGASYKDAFVPEPGTPMEDASMSLAQASPYMLISAVEDGPMLFTPPALQLLPRREDGESDDVFTRVHHDIKDMGQRTSDSLSVSDFLFTHPTASIPEPLQLKVVQENPSYAFIFDAVDPDAKRRKEELETSAHELSRQRKLAEEESEALHELYSRALTNTADTASVEGVSQALWANASLKIKRLGKLYKLRFRFDDTDAHAQTLEACFDATHTYVTCPKAASTQDDALTGELQVTYVPETGSLTLTHEGMAQAASFGFRLNTNRGQSTSFSNIDPRTLVGKTMRLELHPNQLQNALSFYSGKLKILDADSSIIYQGGLNLMSN